MVVVRNSQKFHAFKQRKFLIGAGLMKAIEIRTNLCRAT